MRYIWYQIAVRSIQFSPFRSALFVASDPGARARHPSPGEDEDGGSAAVAPRKKKMDEQSKTITTGNHELNDVYCIVDDLRERWRPRVDGQVADLRDCVGELRQQLDELKSTSPTASDPKHGHGSGVVEVLGSAHLGPSSSQAAPGSYGHGVDKTTRGAGSDSRIASGQWYYA